MADVNTELQLSSTATISLNDTNVRTLFAVPSGAISMSDGYGKAYVIPGNSGLLQSGTSYTLPSTSGNKINVLVIGGGGGGGGGSGRTSYAGYFTGGGGGGAGGNAYALNIPVTPGQSVVFNVGGGGSAGAARDGIYSSGSNGTAGGFTAVTVNSTVVALAGGGAGGLVSPNATGGAAGGASVGTALLGANAGGTAPDGTTYGGIGAKGYAINTAIGNSLAAILTYGANGVTYPEGSGNYNVAGGQFGGGGSGGSCAQSDVYSAAPIYATPGLGYSTAASPTGPAGLVFIWWGY